MKRVAIIVSTLLVLVVAGIMMSRSGRAGSRTQAGDSVRAVDAPATSPVLAAPSPELAAAAAVAMTGEVVTAGLISRRELIESFATPVFSSELADLTSEQVTAMRLAMTGTGRDSSGLSVVEFPLRARTSSRSVSAATVQVWSVWVVSSSGEPVARQAWRTVTVHLALIDHRWLVDGWESAEGPSPALTPQAPVASSNEIVAVLDWRPVG